MKERVALESVQREEQTVEVPYAAECAKTVPELRRGNAPPSCPREGQRSESSRWNRVSFAPLTKFCQGCFFIPEPAQKPFCSVFALRNHAVPGCFLSVHDISE